MVRIPVLAMQATHETDKAFFNPDFSDLAVKIKYARGVYGQYRSANIVPVGLIFSRSSLALIRIWFA